VKTRLLCNIIILMRLNLFFSHYVKKQDIFYQKNQKGVFLIISLTRNIVDKSSIWICVIYIAFFVKMSLTILNNFKFADDFFSF